MDDPKDFPRLYRELADWWPVLSTPEDYAEEAAFYRQAILNATRREVRTLLELGSGGGNNASHLKALCHCSSVGFSVNCLLSTDN